MKDESIGAIVIEVADALELRLREGTAEDKYAARATLISHLMLLMAHDESPLEAMAMLGGQMHVLDEEYPGTSTRYALDRLRKMGAGK